MAGIINWLRALIFSPEFLYLFFGGVTTLINIAVFWMCRDALKLPLQAANVVSWIAAVLFAFVTNKLWVFASPGWAMAILAPELAKFVAARLLTLAMDMGFMQAAVKRLGWNEKLAKVASNVLVVIANFFLSKWFVFLG